VALDLLSIIPSSTGKQQFTSGFPLIYLGRCKHKLRPYFLWNVVCPPDKDYMYECQSSQQANHAHHSDFVADIEFLTPVSPHKYPERHEEHC
jgi:hypothetical protein